MGRKPIGEKAMTAAERQRRYRAWQHETLGGHGEGAAAYIAFLREGRQLVKERRQIEAAQRRLDARVAANNARWKAHERTPEFREMLPCHVPSGD